MKEGKIEQLHHESNSWKRQLAFLLQENSFLVGRISEVLKLETNSYSLEEMEIFLDRVISENNNIKRLQRNIKELEDLLTGKVITDGRFIVSLQKNYSTLKKKITAAEKDFNKLKKDFNNYLTQIYIDDKKLSSIKKKAAS